MSREADCSKGVLDPVCFLAGAALSLASVTWSGRAGF